MHIRLGRRGRAFYCLSSYICSWATTVLLLLWIFLSVVAHCTLKLDYLLNESKVWKVAQKFTTFDIYSPSIIQIGLNNPLIDWSQTVLVDSCKMLISFAPIFRMISQDPGPVRAWSRPMNSDWMSHPPLEKPLDVTTVVTISFSNCQTVVSPRLNRCWEIAGPWPDQRRVLVPFPSRTLLRTLV